MLEECDIRALLKRSAERAHALVPVDAILARDRSLGVSRCFVHGEEMPDKVVTCSWHTSGVWVEGSEGFARSDGSGFYSELPAWRWETWLPRHLLPGSLRGWQTAVRVFRSVRSVDRQEGVGGDGGWHEWVCPDERGFTEWAWLDPRLDGREMRLVRAYGWVRFVSWLWSMRGCSGRTRRG